MTLTPEQRRTRILEVVRAQGTVRVVDLAAEIGLAAVTVRRDVAALAEEGALRRSHGAVALPQGAPAVGPDGRGLVVGMLVPTVGLYFDEVIAGARAAADQVGARLVLGVSAYRAADDRVQVAQLLRSGAGGLLLTPSWTPERGPETGDWIGELPVPTVLVERRPPAAGPLARLDSVGSDHRAGVLAALRHLVSLGHDRVLLAARTDSWTAHEVRAGYAEAVRALGLAPVPVVELDHVTPDLDAVASTLVEAAASGIRAALVHNDQDALRLAPLLRSRGVRMPEDLAVVSYDDVVAALADPPLTAVAPPKYAVGRAAMELLLRHHAARGALPVHHVQLLPDLVVRPSCGGTGTPCR
ncbi:DNA-binding LacI/PurR family transcriptional regulator [Streptacidiphilus sp. MAP12-33]|uniref:substrate-binding domain-containing protein n=1 Tax=Streptacidiphilus sp. MAP12-33 TaxID=3156266 RepID=UPI003517593E